MPSKLDLRHASKTLQESLLLFDLICRSRFASAVHACMLYIHHVSGGRVDGGEFAEVHEDSVAERGFLVIHCLKAHLQSVSFASVLQQM